LFAGAVSPFDASALPSVAIGLGVMLFGVACGLAPLLLLRPRAAGMWAMPVLFAGMVRMLAGLSAGLWAWFAFEPHRIGFWGAILVTGVAALIAEVVAVMPTLRGDALHNHHTESTQGEPSPA
jgi:hypothetical protein